MIIGHVQCSESHVSVSLHTHQHHRQASIDVPLSLPTPTSLLPRPSSACILALALVVLGQGSPTADLPILVKLLGLPTGKGPTSTFERAPSPLNLGFTEEPLEGASTLLCLHTLFLTCYRGRGRIDPREQQQCIGHHRRTLFTFPPPSILDE